MDSTFEYCNEQPARIIFILLLTPILFMKGFMNKDIFVMVFAILLFLCECI